MTAKTCNGSLRATGQERGAVEIELTRNVEGCVVCAGCGVQIRNARGLQQTFIHKKDCPVAEFWRLSPRLRHDEGTIQDLRLRLAGLER